jgi:AcrR family transcriptional regulator
LAKSTVGIVTDSSHAASQPGPALGTGGPRSEGTRRAILGAARATFAARGYEQTTIRAVAAQAGVDASMVMRYFGSKAGLFTAAVTMDLDIPDLRSVPTSGRGELLVRLFVTRWEHPVHGDEMIAMLRAGVTSEIVAEQFQSVLGQLVTEPIAVLGDERAAERGTLIAAQLLGLGLCRYILRFEPLASMSADAVVAAVGPSVQRYLTQPDLTQPDLTQPVGRLPG